MLPLVALVANFTDFDIFDNSTSSYAIFVQTKQTPPSIMQ